MLATEVRMVLYLMVACLVMLYILSIVYVIRDAQRRGAEPWWLWAVISIIPIVGLLAYVILRPTAADIPGRPLYPRMWLLADTEVAARHRTKLL